MDLDMYAEELLSSYETQEHKHKMEKPDAEMHEENVSCGDRITVFLKVENGTVKDVSYEGDGCVISMGSANILMEKLKGRSVQEIESMDKNSLIEIINLDPGPVRMHCATLSLKAIKEALFKYENKQTDRSTKEL
jgi:nitrogen fixation NifU-like protein